MKAVLHFRAGSSLRALLEETLPAWLEVEVVAPAYSSHLARALRDADVLWHVLEPVTKGVMEAAGRLKLIQKIGVGVNTIDLAAARRRGIAVANMPGTNSQAVAEHTLALMLCVLRRIVVLDRETRAGTAANLPPELLDSTGEIAGRTVGLVGYGEVPSRLAPILQALGATVLHTSRAAKAHAASRWTTLDELLRVSDIVSLHIPWSAGDGPLLDAEALARMKPGSILINTARGQLVDEDALRAALQDGRISGAGLDVLVEEPAQADNPLLALPNVVVTPHIAWQTPETLVRSVAIAVENCRRVRDGETLLHRVI